MEYKGPINPNPADGEAGISIYLYRPWLSGAVVGVATFGLVMLLQIFYWVRYRGVRWFHGLLAVGALMEVGGYAARIKGSANMWLVSVFVAQYFLIVVAPIPIAAAIYIVLTYAAKWYPDGGRLLVLRPRLVVGIFVFMDIVTIAVQVCGAALVGVSQTSRAQGETPPVTVETAANILLAGLAVQTASFSIFICLLLVALKRAGSFPQAHRGGLRALLGLNLGAALLVLLRTVYRLAVEVQGYFGAANSSQVLFTCLEFLPVILALALFSVVPLARFRPREAQIPTEDKY